MSDDRPVIVALDFASLDDALALADRLDPAACRVKVGKELFTRAGPSAVRALSGRGFEVFVDLKFHDIPNTVAAACAALAELGCWMLNVHAAGGAAMMEAARSALGDGPSRPLLVAVTVLTSLDADALAATGVGDAPRDQVLRLARLAEDAGLDGVVCSPLEIAPLRAAHDDSFALVTPGVRPAGSDAGDQVRIATPGAAVAAGASWLVVGRPITRAEDPLAALESINRECRQARRA